MSTSGPSSAVVTNYIPASHLHSLLSDSARASSTLVVDVRDDDFIGGHVPGALNVPSVTFRDSLAAIRTAAKDKSIVVFHCMKSQVRGPKCARIMAEYVAVSGAEFPPIAILEEGFSGWVEFVSELTEENRERWVTAYNKRYHGYTI